MPNTNAHVVRLATSHVHCAVILSLPSACRIKGEANLETHLGPQEREGVCIIIIIIAMTVRSKKCCFRCTVSSIIVTSKQTVPGPVIEESGCHLSCRVP